MAVLTALSALLVYPVVAYARNVHHPTAVALLAASLFLVTVSVAVETAVVAPLVVEALNTVAAACFLGSTWQFSREFVRTESPEPPTSAERDEFRGGFEDVEE